jgi:hypothetical protein
MRKPSPKVVRITALASAAAFVLLPMAPASAATSNSTAYGIKATVLLGAINVTATPTSTFPPGGTTHVVSLDLGTLGNVGALNATTDGDLTAGSSSATGSAANVALLHNAVNGFPAVSADLISADCSANAPDAPTGQSTFTNASIGGQSVVDIHPAANTKLINLAGVLVVTLNEQTTDNGTLTVNAVHIQLGPIVNGQGSLADVIIGQATCGPNVPVASVSAFSFQDLPIVLGALALLVVIGFGIRAGVRRLGSAA